MEFRLTGSTRALDRLLPWIGTVAAESVQRDQINRR